MVGRGWGWWIVIVIITTCYPGTILTILKMMIAIIMQTLPRVILTLLPLFLQLLMVHTRRASWRASWQRCVFCFCFFICGVLQNRQSDLFKKCYCILTIMIITRTIIPDCPRVVVTDCALNWLYKPIRSRSVAWEIGQLIIQRLLAGGLILLHNRSSTFVAGVCSTEWNETDQSIDQK